MVTPFWEWTLAHAGGPPPGALQVTAAPVDASDPSGDFLATTTGLNFLFNGLPAGSYDVTINLDNYLPDTLNNVVVAAGGALDLGSISLAPAAVISGTITSTDPQTPVADATIAALQNNSTVAVTQADSSGNFTFDNLVAGTYTFGLPQASGLVSAPTVTVPAGQQLTNVAISVSPGGVISGTVRNSQNGQPLSGVGVLLLAPDETSLSTATDDTGTYSFSGLAPGSYQVSLLAGGATGPQTVSVTQVNGTVVQANFQTTFAAQLGGEVETRCPFRKFAATGT